MRYCNDSVNFVFFPSYGRGNVLRLQKKEKKIEIIKNYNLLKKLTIYFLKKSLKKFVNNKQRSRK